MTDEEKPATDMTTEKTKDNNEEIPLKETEVKDPEICGNTQEPHSIDSGATSTSIMEEVCRLYYNKYYIQHSFFLFDLFLEGTRELDDDEIEENPAYIPKKGVVQLLLSYKISYLDGFLFLLNGCFI
uniref:LisH domain-containing protein n=1 Tax=Heterorhabditis bacteriophora TaxID=37862 RepID=A0A1I7XHD0_HETBA